MAFNLRNKLRTGSAKPGASRNSGLRQKPRRRMWLAVVVVVTIAAFGAWRLFLTGAAPNNCQKENGVDICDVDQVGGASDTVLSSDAEAQSLGGRGWGWYYGAVFRAPKTAYNGAVPVHRVYSTTYSWHDWVTDTQKRDKEAKYGANNNITYEGVAFFAWADGKQPGTVPVYRLTRAGGSSQSFFTTDRSLVDKLLAESANNPDGWKAGSTMPEVAFYAYPPNYKVAGEQNPYDCSIKENYISDRCKTQRENLEKAVAAGNIPTSNECPKTLETYRKAPFASQFSADCQKFWNTYMQDCSILENFTSDRCKTQREALAKAQQEQARKRAEAAAAAAAAAAQQANGGGSGSGGGGGGGAITNNCLGINRNDRNQVKACQRFLGVTADGIWGPRTQAAYNAKYPPSGGGGTSSTPNCGPTGRYDARADVCKYPTTSTPAPTNNCGGNGHWDARAGVCKYPTPPTTVSTYVCTLKGEKKPTNKPWESQTMRKEYRTTSAAAARSMCTSYRTSLNVQSAFRNFVITSVIKK